MSHSTLYLLACICVCIHVWEAYANQQPQQQTYIKKKCNIAEIIIKTYFGKFPLQVSIGPQCGTVANIANGNIK